MEHESYGNAKYKWRVRDSHKRIGRLTGGFGNKKTSIYHPSIINIDQNTKKNPGNLRRLAVTQAPMKNHR